MGDGHEAEVAGSQPATGGPATVGPSAEMAGEGESLAGLVGCGLFGIAVVEGLSWPFGDGLIPLAITLYRGWARAPVVEFGGSLWFVFFALLGAAALALAVRFGLDERRGATWLGLLAVLALGYAAVRIDAATVAPAVRGFLANRGYGHCPALDREVYMGRGAVNMIEVYVLSGADCPKAAQDPAPA